MKIAISLRTGKEVYANYKLSRRDRYKCPHCSSEVLLRAGNYREPYFAHSSNQTNQAKLNCEEYYIGFGYHSPTYTTKRVIPIAESKTELRQQNCFTTLCVEDSKNDFNLYLSLPNIPFDKENPVSLRDLQKIKLRVTADGNFIGQLPAIELFTGGMKTRFNVKPTEKDYKLEVFNEKGFKADFDFFDDSIEGLSPKGNLFGKTEDEWIRILPNSEVEWGEEFYYVGLSTISVPNICCPTEIAVRNGYTRKWKLWRIALPEEPDASVEDWLKKIDYFAVEARWRLQLLSVPLGCDAFKNVYYFNEGEPILFKAMSPFSKSETVLVCESTELIEEKSLKTNADNNCFFSVKGHFDNVYLKDFPETEIKAIFIDDDDSHSLSEKISSLPFISLRLKDDFFGAFAKIDYGTPNTILTSEEFNPTDIEILLKPEGLNDFVERRVGIHFIGDVMAFKNRLTIKEAKSEILNIIRKKYNGYLTIDAGSLGIIALRFENEIFNYRLEPELSSKISGWLSAVAFSSRGDGKYIGLNSDFRKSIADKKSRHKIVHCRSAFVTAQSRAMSKRKK